MGQINKFATIVVVAFLIALFAEKIESPYLEDFFADNAVLLGVAVFAVHAASSAILISQLAILRNNLKFNFDTVCKSIQNSFIESFVLLLGIIICAIANGSKYMIQLYEVKIYLSTALLFCVIALLAIVYDTCKAIIICFQQPT